MEKTPKNPLQKTEDRDITEELRESYLDYAMSVIVARALPDVRDGLKPVQRRILWAMREDGLTHSAKFRKSANVVGSVLGRYHPHGDAAVYDTMARMTQDFSLRYPLVEGQGNWGCFTKDTKIKLTDGRSLNFKELIKEDGLGKKNYTYTVNSNGLISIAEIKNPRLTKKNAEIIKIILDNGEEIKCTPNHLFMLKDDSYKEARNLTPQDSLMPLYQKLSEKTDRLNREGIDLIHQEINQNHKIIKIEALSETADVYDLTIDNTHNFALAAGIFVHNSIDGDEPAAMRYTEARLSKIADELLLDIEKETVDWQANYDNSRSEPKFLPAKLPGLIINGAVGIAVGMATSIPPHNLNEIADAIIYLMDNPEAGNRELMKFVPGPDFPTGGIVYSEKAVQEAYETGRGSVPMRGAAEIEERKSGGFQIVITEVPYQVNKASLVMKIAELVQEKRIEGIRDVRDESDREGIRVVIELKSDAAPQKILNQLYEYTDLQKNFHFNMIALASGIQPKIFSLKEILSAYVSHRKEVTRRRTEFELKKAEERAHILEGLVKALGSIDRIIALIKKSKDREAAKINLIKVFDFTEIQANAILEMRLHTLAALEREKLESELKEKKELIAELKLILKYPKKIAEIIKKELNELKEKFKSGRRTKIAKSGLQEFREEDLVAQEEVIITLSRDGYIKRMQPQIFRSQKRGGKGLLGFELKEEDQIEHLLSAQTHDNILFFTNRGRVFQTKVYEIPAANRTGKGRAIYNFLEAPQGEKITAIIAYAAEEASRDDGFFVMATKRGLIKKTAIQDFANVRRTGIIAITLKKDDELNWAGLSGGKDEFILATEKGQAIRFKEKDVRAMGRAASGVLALRLRKNDSVAGMDIIDAEAVKTKEAKLLAVMANGYGKKTAIKEYKIQRRGGAGIKTANVTDKTGQIIAAKILTGEETEIVAFSSKGQAIKTQIKDVRETGRAAQGVKIMNLDKDDKLMGVVCL